MASMNGNAPLSWAELKRKRDEELAAEQERLALEQHLANQSNVDRVPTDGYPVNLNPSVRQVPMDVQREYNDVINRQGRQLRDPSIPKSLGHYFGTEEAQEDIIVPGSPFANVLLGKQKDDVIAPVAVVEETAVLPPLEEPRIVDERTIAAVGPETVDDTEITASVTPNGAPAVTVPVDQQPTPEKVEGMNKLWAAMGADTESKRQAAGSALMRAGAAMMGHRSDDGSFFSALGAGMTAGLDGYDSAVTAQRQTRMDEEKLGAVARQRDANERISKIMRDNPNWQNDPLLRNQIATLLAANGDLAGATSMTVGNKGEVTAGMREYEFYRNQEVAAGRTPLSFGEYETGKGGSTRVPDLQKNLNRMNLEREKEGKAPLTLEEYETLQDRRASDTKFSEKAGEKNADTFNDMQKVGVQSTVDLANIDTLETALANTPGGFSNLLIASANDWGLGDLASSGASSVALSEAMINKLVPAQRPPGSGAMSDADLDLFKRSLPRLQNSPEGNRWIITTMRGIANYNKQVGNIAARAMAGEIKQGEAIEQMSAIPSPMADFNKTFRGTDLDTGTRRTESRSNTGPAEGTRAVTRDGRNVVRRNGKWILE